MITTVDEKLTILERTQISLVSPKGVQNRAGGAFQLVLGKHKVIFTDITHGQNRLRHISKCKQKPTIKDTMDELHLSRCQRMHSGHMPLPSIA